MSDLDLTEAVEAVRTGWPGHHFTRDGALFVAPPVREGGATARLIEYAVQTATPLIEAQVRERLGAELDALADKIAADAERFVGTPAWGYEQLQAEGVRRAACVVRGGATA